MFPVFFIGHRNNRMSWDCLVDTGATKSCMNYDMYVKLGESKLHQRCVPTVTAADGGNLGAIGITTLRIQLGDIQIEQEFIICTHLKHNIILGIDFTRTHCAGVSWTKEGTRILTIRGQNVIEVREDELGIPVTARRNVAIPPRTGGIFNIDINADFNTNQILTPHKPYFEEQLTVYPHEIIVPPLESLEQASMHIMHVTNISGDKWCHIRKGDIVGFAHPDKQEVQYISVLAPDEKIKQLQVKPRNWIPRNKQVTPLEIEENFSNIDLMVCDESYPVSYPREQSENSCRSRPNPSVDTHEEDQHTMGESQTLKTKSYEKEVWQNIQEIITSDFLTSPADVYPNRRVQLEDAEISKETQARFDDLCNTHEEAFSKSNQDIGKTTLIEMDIDTGDSLPVAQSPYTLPLKYYEWVRKEIETLEKAGVIVKSLSPWASPVIVVPKKSAPDEPPRRRLVIDYRKINALQQQIKRADKSTGCLSLYPLPKIDEMLAKLNGARIFLTIDLRSGYYHIGLTEESRPKSAFVVPMGKYEFKRTPFGLSQAPAYFQLLIDNVLQGCSGFAMGYLDDIIIFSKSQEEHLTHLQKIFIKLEEFGLKMKREKCDFFKKHLQYLGHLVSEGGFEPLPEKMEAIKKYASP